VEIQYFSLPMSVGKYIIEKEWNKYLNVSRKYNKELVGNNIKKTVVKVESYIFSIVILAIIGDALTYFRLLFYLFIFIFF